MLSGLVILNTSRCNLNCAHCLRGYDHPKQDISLDIVRQLLSDSKPFGAKHVALTGGEPGLHPAFDELIEAIVNAGYRWSVVSNGQKVEIYENALYRYGFALTSMAVSLDGASPATHDFIRGEGTFNKAIRAAQFYVDKGHQLYIATCFNRKNLYEYEQIVSLSRDLGASRITVMSVIPTEWNSRLVLSDLEKSALFRELIAIKKKYEIEIYYGSSLHTIGGVCFCNSLSMCEIAVNTFGELIFCCDTIGSGAVIGSLEDDSLSDLLAKWLATSAALQSKRLIDVGNGNEEEGFNSCAFCNSYFNEPQ